MDRGNLGCLGVCTRYIHTGVSASKYSPGTPRYSSNEDIERNRMIHNPLSFSIRVAAPTQRKAHVQESSIIIVQSFWKRFTYVYTAALHGRVAPGQPYLTRAKARGPTQENVNVYYDTFMYIIPLEPPYRDIILQYKYNIFGTSTSGGINRFVNTATPTALLGVLLLPHYPMNKMEHLPPESHKLVRRKKHKDNSFRMYTSKKLRFR